MAILLGPAPDAAESYLSWEYNLPVLPWTGAIYALAYPFVLIAPLCCRRKRDLRALVQMGFSAAAVGLLCFLLVPLAAPLRPFQASGTWGRVLMLELRGGLAGGSIPVVPRSLDFHCSMALCPSLRAEAPLVPPGVDHGTKLPDHRSGLRCQRLRIVGNLCVCAKRPAPLAMGVEDRRAPDKLMAGMAHRADPGHRTCRILWSSGFDRRHHCIPSGGPGTDEVSLVDRSLHGSRGGNLGAILEGKLQSRVPFGFFGGLIGGTIGVFAAGALGGDAWRLAGAISVAGPFAQATGRLRCLVQGCCHGRECARATESLSRTSDRGSCTWPTSVIVRFTPRRSTRSCTTWSWALCSCALDALRPFALHHRIVSHLRGHGTVRRRISPWRTADAQVRRPPGLSMARPGGSGDWCAADHDCRTPVRKWRQTRSMGDCLCCCVRAVHGICHEHGFPGIAPAVLASCSAVGLPLS